MADQTLAQIVVASPTGALDGTEDMYFLQSGGDTGGPVSLIKTLVLGSPVNHGIVVGTATGIAMLTAAAAGTLLQGGGASADPAFTATPTLGIVSSVTGQLKLANSASANLTIIQAGNAAAARTYTWPTNFGAAGGALTDAGGDGTLSWVVPASGLTIGTTAITSGTGTHLLYETSGNKVGEISGATSDGTALTLVAPVLGTPASGTLTNCTGLPAAGVVGTAAVLGANTFTDTQTITQGTATHSLLVSTGGSNTGSNTASAVDLAWTLNTSGSPDVIALRVTDTARGGSTKLLNLYGGASGTTSKFSVDYTGAVICVSVIQSSGSEWAIRGTGMQVLDTGFFGWASNFNGAGGTIDTKLGRGGVGIIKFLSAGSFSAPSTTATVLGSIGPAGANTTVQTWLTIVDNGGTTRYIPCF